MTLLRGQLMLCFAHDVVSCVHVGVTVAGGVILSRLIELCVLKLPCAGHVRLVKWRKFCPFRRKPEERPQIHVEGRLCLDCQAVSHEPCVSAGRAGPQKLLPS